MSEVTSFTVAAVEIYFRTELIRRTINFSAHFCLLQFSHKSCLGSQNFLNENSLATEKPLLAMSHKQMGQKQGE